MSLNNSSSTKDRNFEIYGLHKKKISKFSHLPLQKSAVSQRECSYKSQVLHLIQRWSDTPRGISAMEAETMTTTKQCVEFTEFFL